MLLILRWCAGRPSIRLALICTLMSACASRPEPDAPAQDAPAAAPLALQASAPVETPAPSEPVAPEASPRTPDDDASDEPEDFAGMIEAHNRWRRQVGTPPLGWSKAAARTAQAWAEELARRDCKISHSPGDDRRMTWGENVYSYWRGGAYEGWRKTPDFVVDRWAAEGQWYDHASNSCSAPRGMVCGHFTQVVSTYTTHVGCGRARCASAEVWVCNYSPPGNYNGVAPY
jgi:pathogenesis-related protein 1